jgi:hypothetical protein
MTDLARLRSDLRTFSLAIEQPLADWQAASLALESRTTVVVGPRQSGKSRAASVVALHWTFRNPGARVLLISAGEDAAKRLLSMCADATVRSPLLGASVVDETTGELTFSNGSAITSVPSSEAQVRGRSVDLLVLDEMAQLEDELIRSAALPTTAARPNARILIPPDGPFGKRPE